MLWGLQPNLETLSQKLTYAFHTSMVVWLCHTCLKPGLPVSAQPHHSKDRWGKHVPNHREVKKFFLPPHIPSTLC